MYEFIVVGLGNVGLRVAYELNMRGYRVLGLDGRGERLKIARDLGIEAKLVDAERVASLGESFNRDSVIVVAMPSDIGVRVSSRLASNGFKVVDVSLRRRSYTSASDVKRGGLLLPEAGVSPGLSNVLAYHAIREKGGPGRLRVYVGSISSKSDGLLGYVATWSTREFLMEYTGKSLMIRGSRPVEVDPLDPKYWGSVSWPGIGTLEYFVSDAMRRFLLRNAKHLVEGAELTIRRPGHLSFMRRLREIGLLDSSPLKAGGCPVSPLEFTARLFEKTFKGVEDMVLLRVEYDGPEGAKAYSMKVVHDEEWSATSKAVGGMEASFAEMVSSNMDALSGVIYPEDLVELGMTEDLLKLARSRGLLVEEG